VDDPVIAHAALVEEHSFREAGIVAGVDGGGAGQVGQGGAAVLDQIDYC
jgi:hypothetical protein